MAWLLRWFVQTIYGSKDNLSLSEHWYLEAGRVWVWWRLWFPKVIYFIKWCFFIFKSIIQTHFLHFYLLFILKARTLLLCMSILTRKQKSHKVPIISAKWSKKLQYINETWAFSKIQHKRLSHSGLFRAGVRKCFPLCCPAFSSELISWANHHQEIHCLYSFTHRKTLRCHPSSTFPSWMFVPFCIFAGIYHSSY